MASQDPDRHQTQSDSQSPPGSEDSRDAPISHAAPSDPTVQVADIDNMESPPSSTQTQGAGAPLSGEISTINLIDRLQADPDSTAKSALADNFSKAGAGDLAILFHRLATLKGNSANEAWAKFMGLLQILWGEEHHAATQKLLGDALIRLSPPRPFDTYIREEQDYASDYITYTKIKTLFDAGDEEAATGLLAKLNKDNREMMRDAIQHDSRNRRVSRRRAFIAAGILLAVLLGANVIGASVAIDLARNPPKFTLPEFKAAPGSVLSDLPLSVGQDSDAPVSLTPGAEADMVFPDADLTSSPDKTADIDSEQLYNCALARRVISQGQARVLEIDSLAALDKIAAFEATTQKACSDLPVPDEALDKIGREIPTREVEKIVNGILSTP